MTIKKLYFGATVVFVMWLMWAVSVGVILVRAQTQVGPDQVKGWPPIVKVERAMCVGSGPTWNCAGLQMYKLTLFGGMVLGPYVAVLATPEMAADSKWQAIPLGSPDPQ